MCISGYSSIQIDSNTLLFHLATGSPNMPIITIAGYKGGICKSTTAIAVASLLSAEGKTLVIDGDPNRSASVWAREGKLPFAVVGEREAAKVMRSESFEWIVIDTAARPSKAEIEELARGCDLLISPCPPDMLSLDALVLMAQDLPQETNWRVLISAVPPHPQTDGNDLREALTAKGYPTFKQGIRFYKAYKNAVTEGVPIQKTKGGKIGWRDWQTLKPEILKAIVKPSSAKS